MTEQQQASTEIESSNRLIRLLKRAISDSAKLQEPVPEFIVGLDGGGSKCVAIVSDIKGQILGKGVSGPANPSLNMIQTKESILSSSKIALKSANIPLEKLSNSIAGIGLAGVNNLEIFEKINRWEHPFKKMYLTTDVEIANIGAHDGQSGAVIVVGTGSCGYSKSGDKHLSLGGHGFPIGDQASGAWLGLKATEHTFLVLDGMRETDLLSQKVINHYQIKTSEALRSKLNKFTSTDFAKLAPLVFECIGKNDKKSGKLLMEAVDYLGNLSKALNMTGLTNEYHSKTSEATKRDKLCLIGGLSESYRQLIGNNQTTSSNYLKNVLTDAIASPEIGAIQYAIEQWQFTINQQLKK